MECGKASEAMSARLDGRIDPAGSRKLDEHLASCRACREQWRRMLAVDAVLSTASMVAAPVGLSAEVLGRLDRARRLRRGLVGGLGMAAASAAVAVVFILPLGLQLLNLLGIAPALIAGLPETAAHVLPSIESTGRAAVLVARGVLLPLAVVALCSVAAILVGNVVWLGALKRLRARQHRLGG
jgi:predicted anti-sigma-YlaC factor YlaD